MAVKAFNYQQQRQQLDDIVAWFQGEDIDFEQATAKFAKAKAIVKELNNYLDDSKAKLDIK
jgi:exodeoxyribonuclease VII small subunit